MAKKIKMNAFTRGVVGKEALDKIGTYQEAPGGGTPSKGGGRGAMKKDFKVVDSKEEADAIRKSDPDAKIRYNQPRDEDGQFTYNSANAKELVYGPSRGYTVPPFLRGVKLTYVEKGSTLKVKDPEDMRRMTYLLSTINMSPEDIMIKCREYVKSENGFLGMGEGSAIKKMGRKTDAEKAQKGEGVVKQEKKDIDKLASSTQEKIADAQGKYAGTSAGKYDEVDESVFGDNKADYNAHMDEVLDEDSEKMIDGTGLALRGEAYNKGIEAEIPKAQNNISAASKAKIANALKTKKSGGVGVTPSGTAPTDVEKASKALGVDLEEEKDETKPTKAALSDESKQKLTSTIRDTFGEEFADITDDDIMEMYEAGDFDDLDDETLAALGLK